MKKNISLEKTPQPPAHIPSLAILLACLGGVLLGFSAIFVRYSDLGPMTTGFYRLLFALPLLWLWMKSEPRKQDPCLNITRKDYLLMVLAGIFFALDLALWNWSIGYTTIVNATLFNNTAAFFVPLFAIFFLKQKQQARSLIAAMTGFLGCSFLAAESFTISISNLVGDLVSLLSGIMVTLYIVAIKKIRDRLPTGLLMFWTSLSSLIGMGIFVVLFKESFWPLTIKSWISIGGQAFLIHVLGQGFLAYSMGKIPSSYGAMILLLAPVTSALFGWMIFGESLSIIKFLGIIIIMASLIAARPRR